MHLFGGTNTHPEEDDIRHLAKVKPSLCRQWQGFLVVTAGVLMEMLEFIYWESQLCHTFSFEFIRKQFTNRDKGCKVKQKYFSLPLLPLLTL